MKLFEYLIHRNPNGIAVEDAIQLMLGIFCTIDILPLELREEALGRDELSSIFAKMSEMKIIQNRNCSGDIENAAFWNDVIDKFMSGKIDLVVNFREVAALYA